MTKDESYTREQRTIICRILAAARQRGDQWKLHCRLIKLVPQKDETWKMHRNARGGTEIFGKRKGTRGDEEMRETKKRDITRRRCLRSKLRFDVAK